MTTAPAPTSGRTPPHVVVYRSVTAAIAVLLLLSLGFGLAGYGPFAPLHRLVSPVTHALYLDRIQG
jgi:hypothetical protein